MQDYTTVPLLDSLQNLLGSLVGAVGIVENLAAENPAVEFLAAAVAVRDSLCLLLSVASWLQTCTSGLLCCMNLLIHSRERGVYTFKMCCLYTVPHSQVFFYVSTCFFSDAVVGMRDAILITLPVKGCKLHIEL